MDWISPDKRIIKSILEKGTEDKKPSLFSECRIEISSDSFELLQFNDKLLIIGDNCDTYYGRFIDNLLQFTSPLEVSNITLNHSPSNSISFKLKLLHCDHKGYIFEWDAARKLKYAELHKEKGVALYRNGNSLAAANRFSLSLKLLHSIPIDVSNIPESIDNVSLDDIKSIKVRLFNNLAMCQAKLTEGNKAGSKIVYLSKKALELNVNDIKALNRLGSICQCQGDIDSAFVYYSKMAAVEPNNTVAIQKLNEVALMREKENKEIDEIYKRMFCN